MQTPASLTYAPGNVKSVIEKLEPDCTAQQIVSDESTAKKLSIKWRNARVL